MAKRKSGGTKPPEPSEQSTAAAEPSAVSGAPAGQAESAGRQVIREILTSPERIQADEGMNSRRYGSGEVDEMVASLLEDGQQQPVRVRANPEGSAYPYSLVFGYRRHKGAIQINRDKLLGSGQFMLRAEVVEVSGRNAFLSNVAENENRRDLSAIEQAHAMDRLITEFDMTQADVAGKFHVSKATVSQRLKLLEAPEDVQRGIHDGTLSVDAALAALRHGEGTRSREAALEAIAASTPDAPVSADDVRRAGTAEDFDGDGIPTPDEEDQGPSMDDISTGGVPPPPAPRSYVRKLRLSKEILADFEGAVKAWLAKTGAENVSGAPFSVRFSALMGAYLRTSVGFRKIQKLLEEKT